MQTFVKIHNYEYKISPHIYTAKQVRWTLYWSFKASLVLLLCLSLSLSLSFFYIVILILFYLVLFSFFFSYSHNIPVSLCSDDMLFIESIHLKQQKSLSYMLLTILRVVNFASWPLLSYLWTKRKKRYVYKLK
jgi:hypothetical protein